VNGSRLLKHFDEFFLKSCAGQGAPMKRFLTLTLLLGLVFAFSGCSQTQTEQPQDRAQTVTLYKTPT
jgi:hypothetical protein